MILYKDCFSGDELLSDAFDMRVVDDFFIEVDAKLVTEGGEQNYDIGANPSQEEEEEALQQTSTQVLDIQKSFELVETVFEKKAYAAYMKGYLNKVKTWLEENKPAEEVSKFKKNAQLAVTKIMSDFKNLQFFVGKEMHPDGMIVLLKYRDVEDGKQIPCFIYIKDALVEEKV